MRRPRRLGALVGGLTMLALAGCTTAPVPERTVTVTASASASASATLPTLKAGDAAPWDLHAVCAAESGG